MMLDSGESAQGRGKTMSSSAATSLPRPADQPRPRTADEATIELLRKGTSTNAGDEAEDAKKTSRAKAGRRKDVEEEADAKSSRKEEDEKRNHREESERVDSDQDEDDEEEEESESTRSEDGASALQIDANKDPKFICDICHKEFGTKGSLKTHHRVHTGEKPFVCPVQGCGRGFSQHPNCIRHIRLLHPGVNLKNVSSKIHAIAKTKTGKRLRMMEQAAVEESTIDLGAQSESGAPSAAVVGGLSFLRPPFEPLSQYSYMSSAAQQQQQQHQAMTQIAGYYPGPARMQQQQQQYHPQQLVYSQYGMPQAVQGPGPAFVNVARMPVAPTLLFPSGPGAPGQIAQGQVQGMLSQQQLMQYLSQTQQVVQPHNLARGVQVMQPPAANQVWMYAQQPSLQHMGMFGQSGMQMGAPRGQDHR